jgi:hypothetical protein
MIRSFRLTVPFRRQAGRLEAVAVFGACLVAVAGCSSSAGPTPLVRSTNAAVSAMNEVKNRGYLAARRQWLDEGQVWSSAGQAGPLARAIADLEHGQVTDSATRAEYQTIIAAIENLARLPDAMATSAQDAEAQAAVARIDLFFHLHAIRRCNWPSARKECWITTIKSP